MSLKARFLFYLALVHLVFGVVAWILLRDQRLWLLPLELFFIVSFVFAWQLTRRLSEPADMLRTAVELLDSGDLMSRFRETPQPEVNRLIRLYNRMVDHLRDERVANQEQDSLLRRIIALSPSGIVQLDYDGRIQSMNPGACEILGVSEDAARGQGLESLGGALARELNGLGEGEARMVTIRGRRKVRCRRLSFMDRGFLRTCLMFEELTKELHASERGAYEKLIRTMSHEVNNTSGAVISLLESCLAYGEQIGERDRADFESGVGVAVARTRHMNEFMRSFADVVRLPAPDRKPGSLEALLRDVARLFEPECERLGIRWRWQIEDGVRTVLLDRGQMEQALVNIVRNAIDAIGEDGDIAVTLAMEHDVPTLLIDDSGGGIPPEVAPRLFTSFFTSKPNGQGIGLTLVQEILIAHGFDYSLETVAPGRAGFRIRFFDQAPR
ncbi:MAG: PAS domain-containing protein [Candidatus Eisenbacteria bacterium]|uniref:histidine kinase n=1 Tax=Eiseniibacteriota bacterium TaxID=2212470 RepID=A0A849SHS8_UNCEI|nr:PAS domain-containing protein [Candidatus Eisenbacteria bacterium]